MSTTIVIPIIRIITISVVVIPVITPTHEELPLIQCQLKKHRHMVFLCHKEQHIFCLVNRENCTLIVIFPFNVSSIFFIS